MKLEPMTIEEIKELVIEYGPQGYRYPSMRLWATRLILAWAHERAAKNREIFESCHRDCVDRCSATEQALREKHFWLWGHWLNEVLDEIGFPHGED